MSIREFLNLRTSYLVIILCGVLGLSCLLYVFSLPTATRFQPSKYDDLLHRLAVGNYSFVLVHDCDYRIDGLKTLLAVERIYNVKSTCYVRPDAEYFTGSLAYLQKVEREGWSIGFHYDCLSRTNGNMTLALQLFHAQLTFLRSFFNVTSTRYHGDIYNLSIGNRALYNEEEWREMGLTEVSNIPNWSYITDVNGTWYEEPILKHNVLVNLHSDWW